jgi:histidinol phosphatase-like enzyme
MKLVILDRDGVINKDSDHYIHGEIGLAADEVAHIGSCESSDPLR